jgi:hypothetical protein
VNAELVLASAPLAILGTFLLVLSSVDLAKRDPSQIIGGSKIPWSIAMLAIPIGSIAYLWFGRKRSYHP